MQAYNSKIITNVAIIAETLKNPFWNTLFVAILIELITYILALKKKNFNHTKKEKKVLFWNIIIKKIGYFFVIILMNRLDSMIVKLSSVLESNISKSYIMILVSAWYFVNELVTILNNIDAMGTPIPKGLRKILNSLHNKINKKIQ